MEYNTNPNNFLNPNIFTGHLLEQDQAIIEYIYSQPDKYSTDAEPIESKMFKPPRKPAYMRGCLWRWHIKDVIRLKHDNWVDWEVCETTYEDIPLNFIFEISLDWDENTNHYTKNYTEMIYVLNDNDEIIE